MPKNIVNVNDEFILDIKRLGINGEGIGFYNKLTVFVDNAIPGEGHNVQVTNVTEKMAFAKSIEIKNISPARVEPSCIHYEKCGGCNAMHISNEKMLELKKDLLVEAITRYTSLNPRSFEIKPVVSVNQYGYRNRSQLPLRFEDDKIKPSMIMEKSNIMIPIEDCKVQNDILNDLNNSIAQILTENNISVYSYKTKKGVLRYISTRVNRNGEALVCLVCYDVTDLKDVATEIMRLPHVAGVYMSINKNIKSGAEIIGGNLTLLAGDEYIIETIGKIKYRLYPNTFFQLNRDCAERMFETVLKACKLSFKEVVLDAYSGVGAIGLYLAHNASEVIGIESNKQSVEAANENAKLNKISNAKFMQGDAGDLLPKMVKDGKHFDVVVVDPPRTGLDERFMTAVMNSNVKRLVYVSCNPATLAKNIEFMKSKYQVKSITPFDMFPNTTHVETVCLLGLKQD